VRGLSRVNSVGTRKKEPQRLGAAEPQPKCERPLNRRDAKSAEKTTEEKILLAMRDSAHLHCKERGEESNPLFPLAATAGIALADGLPVITTQPQSYISSPGLPATFSVVSANATGTETFTNALAVAGARYSRAGLLP
jgi:hypothetical protein